MKLTVRERLLAIHLMEKETRNPQYAEQIGVHVYWKTAASAADVPKEKKHV